MTSTIDDARAAHRQRADELAAELTDAREHLLRQWAAFDRALAPLGHEVRYLPELSPPLWELGHLAWFEEWCVLRNPQRLTGVAPAAPRAASLLPNADALFHPAQVNHTRRWRLAVPDARRGLAWAAAVRERTLALLRDTPSVDGALAVFHAVRQHEDERREAWAAMAQLLGIALDGALEPLAPQASPAEGEWAVTPELTIDRAPVSWGRFLPFVEAGGYDERSHWSDAGWAWRQQHGKPRPLHLRPGDEELPGWHLARFGQWVPLVADAPALHLTLHEAQAWCRWAGRRLPTAAEWQAAAAAATGEPSAFDWGQVREWMAEGALCGASFALPARAHQAQAIVEMAPERNDGFTGFRSAAA